MAAHVTKRHLCGKVIYAVVRDRALMRVSGQRHQCGKGHLCDSRTTSRNVIYAKDVIYAAPSIARSPMRRAQLLDLCLQAGDVVEQAGGREAQEIETEFRVLEIELLHLLVGDCQQDTILDAFK